MMSHVNWGFTRTGLSDTPSPPNHAPNPLRFNGVILASFPACVVLEWGYISISITSWYQPYPLPSLLVYPGSLVHDCAPICLALHQPVHVFFALVPFYTNAKLCSCSLTPVVNPVWSLESFLLIYASPERCFLLNLNWIWLECETGMFIVYSDTYTHTYTSKRQHWRSKITSYTWCMHYTRARGQCNDWQLITSFWEALLVQGVYFHKA